jgi:glycerol-3-phosphate dehydrogenase (NAD+)
VCCCSQDGRLAAKVQQLMACDYVRINTTDDVVGVEICGALKNVLAIAAGIVDGMGLGHNAMAALVVQGCAEIRWLAERMGAKPTTISGLSGLGDIMLTCYVDLSRNRSVGRRLGKGESLEDILASSSQVAEGVATAGVVVTLARQYKVQLPVLTAVAQVLGNELGPAEAVIEIMKLPQVSER